MWREGGQSRERAAAKQAPDSEPELACHRRCSTYVLTHTLRSRQEPDAGKPQVRIREGGRRKPHPYLDKSYKCEPRRGKVPMHMMGADSPVCSAEALVMSVERRGGINSKKVFANREIERSDHLSA